MSEYKITAEDIENWANGRFGHHAYTWFAEVLNGEYNVDAARSDCLSIVKNDEYIREMEKMAGAK